MCLQHARAVGTLLTAAGVGVESFVVERSARLPPLVPPPFGTRHCGLYPLLFDCWPLVHTFPPIHFFLLRDLPTALKPPFLPPSPHPHIHTARGPERRQDPRTNRRRSRTQEKSRRTPQGQGRKRCGTGCPPTISRGRSGINGQGDPGGTGVTREEGSGEVGPCDGG